MSRDPPLLDVRYREVNVGILMTDVFTGVWTRCLLSTSTREKVFPFPWMLFLLTVHLENTKVTQKCYGH